MSDRELLEPVEVVGYLNYGGLLTTDTVGFSASICRGGFNPLMTVAQHKRIVSKLTDAAEALELLRAENAELELLADDACGKRCPDCGAPMVSLSTIDGGQRVCSGCNKTWDWHLKKGQQPLIGNNRMVNKV